MTLRNTCKDCEDSRAGLWHGYTASCTGCKARAARRSPEYHAARADSKHGKRYKDLLNKLGIEHKDVQEWV